MPYSCVNSFSQLGRDQHFNLVSTNVIQAAEFFQVTYGIPHVSSGFFRVMKPTVVLVECPAINMNKRSIIPNRTSAFELEQEEPKALMLMICLIIAFLN